jgi:hypothetical protein
MTFNVNGSTVETARGYSDAVLATGLERRKNYTDLNRPDRYFHGYIGELSFRNALLYFGKRCHYVAKLAGRSDGGSDIFVWSSASGKKRSVNVKTASEARYRKLMLPERQFKRHPCDVFVAARILDGLTAIRFEGWIMYEELAKREPEHVKVLTRSCKFDELRGMDELFSTLEDETK